jgi:hypothetical protein
MPILSIYRAKYVTQSCYQYRYTGTNSRGKPFTLEEAEQQLIPALAGVY